jgi:pteridine reductase
LGPLFALVNNAAVFERRPMEQTDLAGWERQFRVNLTAPFVLIQAFAEQVPPGSDGRVVNILDWRAVRPDNDHFAYSITKAALAAMTRSAALALAPAISVNGLALGAILPPAGESDRPFVLHRVPAQRWGRLEEVQQALLFLLAGPAYVTGEIIHVDGGRHLV